MAGLLKNHRLILYRLKRDWGLEVILYRPIRNDHDIRTGNIDRGYITYTVEKAPVLPTNVDRSFVYDLAYIAANKNFTEGGFFDRRQTQVILDAKELPKGFEPNHDDFIVFKTKRYEIKSVQIVEELAAFRLGVLAVEGQSRERWLTGKSNISFNATGTV